jgi:hypothetical protein
MTVFFNIYIQVCVAELRPTKYIYRIYNDQLGHAMTHLVEALLYELEDRCHLKSFIDIIFPTALWP